MAIRQDKNYKFNFTLADGSIKTITHDVPLPIASEIGCKGYNYFWEKEHEAYQQRQIAGTSGELTPKTVEVAFNPPPGYVFNINKDISSPLKGQSLTTEIISKTSDEVIVKATSTNGDPTLKWYDIYIKATLISSSATKEEIITNVQNSLDYLYDITENTKQATDTFMGPGRVISIDGEQGEINYSYDFNYADKIITDIEPKLTENTNKITFTLCISDEDTKWTDLQIARITEGNEDIRENCNIEIQYNKNIATITFTKKQGTFTTSGIYRIIIWSWIKYTFNLRSAVLKCLKNITFKAPEISVE